MAKKQAEKTIVKEKEEVINNIELDNIITEANDIPVIELNDIETIIDTSTNIPVNQKSSDFDPYSSLSNLIFYSKEFLLSIDGIYLGGYANQKRDQLISNIDKLEKEIRDSE